MTTLLVWLLLRFACAIPWAILQLEVRLLVQQHTMGTASILLLLSSHRALTGLPQMCVTSQLTE
jgi:hypothetical protein